MTSEHVDERVYAGTIGWSGTETSKNAAEYSAESGISSERQRRILALIFDAGRDGMTVKDLRAYTALGHHGAISGALSNLHRAGRLALLTEVRDRCHVYVTPEDVKGRETIAPRRNKPKTEEVVEQGPTAREGLDAVVYLMANTTLGPEATLGDLHTVFRTVQHALDHPNDPGMEQWVAVWQAALRHVQA